MHPMRRMPPLKPPIGGPRQGRPAKRIPPMKGRIKPIGMAPAAQGEGKRDYLRGVGGKRANKPYMPSRGKGRILRSKRRGSPFNGHNSFPPHKATPHEPWGY